MLAVHIKSVHPVQDLGATVASNIKFPSSATSPVRKSNTMMGLIKSNFSFRNKDVVVLTLV